MTIYVRSSIVSGQCGIGKIEEFQNLTDFQVKTYHGTNAFRKTSDLVRKGENYYSKWHNGGTGFFGSGFIDNAICKQTYKELCKHYKLVSQTPVRMNANSGKMFFYAMFDDSVNDDVKYKRPKWPFANKENV